MWDAWGDVNCKCKYDNHSGQAACWQGRLGVRNFFSSEVNCNASHSSKS